MTTPTLESPATRGTLSAGKALLLLCSAQFMLTLDFAIVNIALPSIQRDLGFSEGALPWVVGAYALFFGGFLLVGGRAGDLFGRKRLFVAGLALFTLASLIGGLATAPIVLIAARAGQGLGAAATSPAVLALIAAAYPEGRKRAMAMGVFGAVASAGFSGGVLLGGVLTQGFGWRSVMFVNVPFGILLIAIAGLKLAADHQQGRRERVDVTGAVLITGGMCAIIYALTVAADRGWSATSVLVCLVGGVALVAAFVALQAALGARGGSPLVPLGVFRNRSVVAGDVIAFLSGGVMSISTYFITLYMQEALGYSALKAGLAFFPQAFVVFLAAKFVADLTGSKGPRPLLIWGGVGLLAGSALLALIPADASFLLQILPGGVLLGLGVTVMMITTAVAATAGVENNRLGLASGIYNSSRQLGVGMCLALAVTLAGVGPQTDRGDVSGYHKAFILSAVLSLLIILFAIALPKVKPVTPWAQQDEDVEPVEDVEPEELPGATAPEPAEATSVR